MKRDFKIQFNLNHKETDTKTARKNPNVSFRFQLSIHFALKIYYAVITACTDKKGTAYISRIRQFYARRKKSI